MELVPKMGVGIICVYVDEMSLLYHMDKNGVKAARRWKKECEYG